MEELEQIGTTKGNNQRGLSLGAIGILLATSPTTVIAQKQSDIEHTLSFQKNLPLSTQVILDLALPQIQQAYNDQHPNKTDTIQINTILNHTLENKPGTHANNNKQLSYRLDMHHLQAAIDLEISINEKIIKLQSKEGMKYATIIYNTAQSMGLTAFITDQNQIHICITDGIVKLLKYYPELYNYQAVRDFYNHFNNQYTLDYSYKNLIELLDQYFNGENITRNYIELDSDGVNNGGNIINSMHHSGTSSLLNARLPSSSH